MPAGMKVEEIMNADVLTATPEIGTLEALRMMAKRGVGSIVVMRDDRPLGIFTERDLLYKVVLERLNPSRVPLGDVVTRRVISVRVGSSLDDAYQKMREGNFRHLLVMNGDGRLAGILSVKDLIRVREQVLQRRVVEKTAELVSISEKLARSLETLNREMEVAGKFQRHLVVKKHPRIEGIKFSQVYDQTQQLGGDFFEVIRLDKNHAGIFMADVMGHGITSAMIAVELKINFDNLAKNSLSPAQVISGMNAELIPLMPEGFFVAGFYGILDLNTLEMVFTQFGLPKPTLLRGDSLRVRPLLPVNMPIGIRKKTLYKEGRVRVRRGDSLLLFTDGCIEQKNKNKKILGEKRFIEKFKSLVRDQNNNIVVSLHREVLMFAGDVPVGDDIAILLCEFLNKK